MPGGRNWKSGAFGIAACWMGWRMNSQPRPSYGEIWRIDFDPTQGHEQAGVEGVVAARAVTSAGNTPDRGACEQIGVMSAGGKRLAHWRGQD